MNRSITHLVRGLLASLLVVTLWHAAPALAADAPQAAGTSSMRWVQPFTASNFTCRMIARPSVAGNGLRIRLSNVFGSAALTLNAVYVGLQSSGAAVTSNTQVMFSGTTSITIPAGQEVTSDQVSLAVTAQQNIAVSLYIAGSNPPLNEHPHASTTSYCTALSNGGNHAADTAGTAFTNSYTKVYWLTAVDVYRSSTTGTIVAIGDSITDGAGSSTDGYNRWTDILSSRILVEPSPKSVVNAGIAGNMACSNTASWGPGIVDRLDRDALAQTGVSHVIVFAGTNDISFGNATGSAVITCLQNIINTVHSQGRKVIGATLIPRSNFTTTQESYRTQVNTWIRNNTGGYDGIIDFDAVVRDPDNASKIRSAYDSDGTHPNATGHAVMGYAIDLNLFVSNLLTNPGGETGSLSPWQNWPSGGSVVSSNARSSSYAFKQTGSNAGIYRTVSGLTPNTTYTFRGWLKAGSTSDQAYLYAKSYGGTGVNSSTSSSTSYTQASLTFTTGASNTSAEIGLWRSADMGSGTVYADDFELVATNLLSNAGLESGSLSPWTNWPSGGSVVSSNVHSGSYTAKQTGSSAGISRTISGLSSNTTYVFRAWIKAGASGNKAYLYAKNFGGQSTQSVTSGALVYQQVSLTFTTGASNTSAEIGLWRDSDMGSGDIYTDDFQFVKP